MSIQLQQFLNVAKSSNVTISQDKQGDVGLKTGRFQGRTLSPFNADKAVQKEKNLQTTGLFLNALAKEYGSDIASSLATKLDLKSGNKPLSGKVIQRVVDSANALKAFNAQAVKDYMQAPSGALKTLADNGHMNWLNLEDRVENKGFAAGKQFVTLLQKACQDVGHPLTQKEIAQLAEGVIDNIHRLPKAIEQGFAEIIDAFKGEDHYLILQSLDANADRVAQLGQFHLADVDREKLGADDQTKYQQQLIADVVNKQSVNEAAELLTHLQSHSTSKELFALLGSFEFANDVSTALIEADLSSEEISYELNKLTRTKPLLDALMTELDKRAHQQDSISEDYRQWLGIYSQADHGGNLNAVGADFAKSFLAIVAKAGVDLRQAGL